MTLIQRTRKTILFFAEDIINEISLRFLMMKMIVGVWIMMV